MENSKNCQKRLLENSEKFNYASFNRLRISFYQSNVLFDWSKRNRESIELGRNFMMKFFIVLIDWEFLSIDRMLISIDWTRIENQLNDAEALWWIYSFFDRSNVNFDQSNRNRESIDRGRNFAMNFFIFLIDREKVRPIEDTEFWIFTCFWLSVKTLIKSKAMWLIL